MKVYGIPNCDTVKKALNWFKANNVMYEFYDFRKLGLPVEKLAEWDSKAGYESFLNKKSTTWKELDEHIKDNIKTNVDAIQLLQQKTSIIKRPVIEDGKFLHFGFDEKVYTEHFNNK
ncbi:Spx/MgsR family RNA polymerase-binding regulatory protein [Mucilaginibacter calamicampi]|uniref:Spx/MgsR family RNA polymerase-binding regulatory protein n=1 Tax=Mucilaginibacter calamicampi TaxID=1302352 RepID=A0ABW2YWB0_9SPHI